MSSVSAKPWAWSPEVIEFARGQGLTGELDPLMEAARQRFPTAREMRIYLARDPEDRDDLHIVWEIDVPKTDLANYGDLSRQWRDEVFRHISREKISAICTFIIPV